MKAVRIHRFGGVEALSVDDLDRPQPQKGEALVRVRAASVNPVDCKIRLGAYPPVKEQNLPLVLGRDVAGVIEICGAEARLRDGDAVFAMLGADRGGYEEYVVVKADELAAKPQRLSFVESAAVPLAGLTAWQGLFDHGGLKPGQRVLIHGGAGGVGHLAIQFAKAKGAWVATTAARGDFAFVAELGADLAIDYQNQRFEDELSAVDLVLDLVDGETQDRSWAVLREGGALVSTLREPDQQKAHGRRIRAAHFTTAPNGLQLAEIARLIDAGKVTPRVAATFPLEHAANAQHRLETQHTRGKLVLDLTVA